MALPHKPSKPSNDKEAAAEDFFIWCNDLPTDICIYARKAVIEKLQEIGKPPEQFLAAQFPGVRTEILKLWLHHHREFCRRLVIDAPKISAKHIERWVASLKEELKFYKESQWGDFHPQDGPTHVVWLTEQIMDPLETELNRSKHHSKKFQRTVTWKASDRRDAIRSLKERLGKTTSQRESCKQLDFLEIPMPESWKEAGARVGLMHTICPN